MNHSSSEPEPSPFEHLVGPGIILIVALGGAYLHFLLISDAMAAMVGGDAAIGSLSVAQIAALVMVVTGINLGICLMDSLGVTNTSGYDSSFVDNDNDGLWTAYHVAAMSLCYGATSEAEAKRSARQSLHALVMLQNASGVPGLVARSVVSAEEGRKKSARGDGHKRGAYMKTRTN